MLRPAVDMLQRINRRFFRVALDASKHPAELYYADIYLDEVREHLPDGQALKILEAGCGTGRLMIPIARMGHHLTGIDYHRDSLRLAQQNLDAAGVRARLIEADLLDALSNMDDASFDVALAIESLYVNEHYDKILEHLARIVRPGGLLFISHRTRFYYLTRALAQGHFDDLRRVARDGSADLRKGMHRVYYHWQTRRQIEATYASLGLTVLKLTGVGLCSGFGDDPLATLCDPGTLDENSRRVLREVETCDDELLMASRYVLAVARKPQTMPAQA